MSDALKVQRAVGIAHIEAFRDQTRCQEFRTVFVAANVAHMIFLFRPYVCAARHTGSLQAPWLSFDSFVCKNAKRRNDVLGEIFVLIIAPDQNKVGPEFINDGSDRVQTADQNLAMLGGCSFSLVRSPFPLHQGWPVRRILHFGGNGWIAERATQNAGHILIASRQRRIVSHAQT